MKGGSVMDKETKDTLVLGVLAIVGTVLRVLVELWMKKIQKLPEDK